MCGKVFLSNSYLQGHVTRRHSIKQPEPELLKLINVQTQPSSQPKIIRNESNIKESKSEDAGNVKKQYQEEIEELKCVFFAEIEKLKQSEITKTQSVDGDIIQTYDSGSPRDENFRLSKESNPVNKEKLKQSEITKTQSVDGEIIQTYDSGSPRDENFRLSKESNPVNKEVSTNLKNSVSHTTRTATKQKDKADQTSPQETQKNVEVEWQRRMEEKEGVGRARMSAIDQHHKQQVNQLQDKLESSLLQGQEMKKDLECRLKEALNRFEKSQALLESKLKAVEENSQKDIINKAHPIKSQSSLSLHSVETIEDTIPLNEKPQKATGSGQAIPLQRRKAFISQKSKTIQEELPEPSPLSLETNNVVEMLNSDEESDIENIPVQSLITVLSKEDNHYSNQFDKTSIYPFLQIKETSNERKSISRQPGEIIKSLLEKEKRKSFTAKNDENKTRLIDDGSSSSESLESESESSSTEHNSDDSKLNPNTSDDLLLKTKTQLTQQSLQSMEALLAANPKIMDQLRDDLKHLLNRRLQGLGVDPGWAGLPPATYHHKMDHLAHQRRITAKSHKVYFTLRDKLNRDADSKVRSHPIESTTDTLLARLRKKATQVINAAKFTRQKGTVKNKGNENFTAPLAASSPKPTPIVGYIGQEPTPEPSIGGIPMTTKSDSVSSKDSLSLSSSTYEDDEEEEVGYPKSRPILQSGSVKSALRNAMSTGNLAKKKVLFVDQKTIEDRRSLSENSVEMKTPIAASSSVSVANLVQDIQQQLTQRRGKPAHSVDVSGQLNTSDASRLPLSLILPLTKSGRELLESEHLLTEKSATTSISKLEKPTNRTLQPISHIVKKVPIVKQDLSELKDQSKISAAKDLLQPLKLSPVMSHTSISSSLLDLSTSASPRDLNWDLQDLEENLRDY